MGRPTKYTEERATRICQYLRDGADRRSAAEASGVSYDTLLAWTKRFSVFSAQVTAAEADCAAAMAQIMTTHALKDWRAAESWLKRRRPQDWGDKQTIDTTQPTGLMAFDRIITQDSDGGDTDDGEPVAEPTPAA